MKKIVVLLFLSLVLVACGGEGGAGFSDYEQAFIDEGFEADGKPLYEMIGAADGAMFYHESAKIAIYEFKSEKDIKKATEALPAMKDWEKNGLIMLETGADEAIKLFNEVK